MIDETRALKLDADDMITIENSLEMAYHSFLIEIESEDHSEESNQNMRAIVASIERTLNKLKNFLDTNESELGPSTSNRLAKSLIGNSRPMIEKKDDDEWQ